MDFIKTKIVKTEDRYEFSTEDIEDLIKGEYQLDGDVTFNWDISQGVSLTVVVKKVEPV